MLRDVATAARGKRLGSGSVGPIHPPLGRAALVMCYQGAGFVGRIDFSPGGSSLGSDGECTWLHSSTTY